MTPLVPLLAMLASQGAPKDELPFDECGTRLIRFASAGSGRESPRASETVNETMLARELAGAHHVIDLGGVELWVPRATVELGGRMGPPPSTKSVQACAEVILALEQRWIEAAQITGAQRERARKTLRTLDAWIDALPDGAPPKPPDELGAELAWLDQCFLGDPERNGGESPSAIDVVMIAPTRAHYLGVIGASGILAKPCRQALWNESARRSIVQALTPSMLVIALVCGPSDDGGPWAESHPVAADDLRQQLCHQVSHSISLRLAPSTPSWFREGVAIVDTIHVIGEDETLCSGHRPTWSRPGQPTATAFSWVARELSPYRGMSAGFFRRQLAATRGKLGFEILDLESGRVALHERGPFLEGDGAVPRAIDAAREGVKQGYAEFFRAYCAAFVRFLETQKKDGETLYARTWSEFCRCKVDPRREVDASLSAVLARATGMELRATDERARDLEARLLDWLE